MTSAASAPDRPPGSSGDNLNEAGSENAEAESALASFSGLLDEIVDQLAGDPGQCWQALEGLAALEPPARVSIIAELARFSHRPGVVTLLGLLSMVREENTRAAARLAAERSSNLGDRERSHTAAPSVETEGGGAGAGRVIVGLGANRLDFPGDLQASPRLAHSLVTPLDGQGRGTIVISVSRAGQRRTAAFLCDVEQGICDVFGEVEAESPEAGRLLDDLIGDWGDECARGAPELALGLLAGSMTLAPAPIAPAIRDWILGTLGPEFQPAEFPASIGDLDPDSVGFPDLPARVCDVLDACPSWIDDSPLARELAEEICLREGRARPDPERDAGAYRFLFEHRLIHRLELYRRMLLWMAGIWKCSGEWELARSAQALVSQLCDDQYAVPSHPFMVELTTRSLLAAQTRSRAGAGRG